MQPQTDVTPPIVIDLYLVTVTENTALYIQIVYSDSVMLCQISQQASLTT